MEQTIKLMRVSISYDRLKQGWRLVLLDSENRVCGKSNHVYGQCDDIWLALAMGPIDMEIGYG